MKRKKKFLALGLAAAILLSSITIALAVTTADDTKPKGFDLPAPVTEVSDNIPELGDWFVLKHYTASEDYPNSNPNILSGGNDGVAALYPSGELYYINEADEIKLSDQAKDYAYVGASIYADRISILEQDGTLWNWRWEEGAEQPAREKVADNVADISDNGSTFLKIDGTLWEWSWKEGEEGFSWHQEDQNIKAIIDDNIYVKNDNTTWSRYSNKQIADFGATDVVEGSAQDSYDEENDWWRYAYFYFAVDESGAVWKIRESDPSDCKKIAEGFDSWEGTENQIYGFRTADGYSYDFETNTKEASALDVDKTLWLGYQDERSPLLNDVEAYQVERDGHFDSEGQYTYTYVMTRSDGSIWAYNFNGVGMDVPVMIKEPIGAESFTLGDVNLDGKVNTSDARLALRGAANLEALTPQQILAADVNKNGKADTSDARKILRVAANLDQF